MTRRRPTAGAVALAAAALALTAIAALAIDVASPRAVAAPTNIPPRVSLVASTHEVTVTSDRGLPARFVAFSPGSVERWRLTATTSAAADLTLVVDRSGPLAARPDGLALAVASCSREWSAAGACGASSASILPPTALVSGRLDTPLRIGRVGADVEKHLLLTFSMPDTPAAETDDSLMSLSAKVGVTVRATGGLTGGVRPGQGGAGQGGGGLGGPGDGAAGGGGGTNDQSAGSQDGASSGDDRFGPGLLAWTGSSIALPGAVGSGLVVGGAILAVRRRRTRRPAESRPAAGTSSSDAEPSP